MSNINLNILTGSLGTAQTSGIGVSTTPIDLKWSCNECDEVSFNPEISCEPDLKPFNCERCGDDAATYERPWVAGDCLYFQFQNQNTLNAPNPISLQNYLTIPPPTIAYSWYHSVYNPTNWTIKAEMYNICDTNPSPTPVTDADFEALWVDACVGLVQDKSLSYKGYPAQAWYKWVQNLKICMDPTLLTNIPDAFYIKFTVKKYGSGQSYYYSAPFRKVVCGNSITIEGIYDFTDCLGFIYGDLKKYSGVFTGIDPAHPPTMLGANCVIPGALGDAGYRNTIRIMGEVYYNGETISRETPYRQKASTVVRSYKTYRNLYRFVPPYIAAEIARNYEGKYTLVTGATMERGTIRVQLNGSLNKNWDMGRYWYPDFETQSFECVQDMNCAPTY